MQPINHSPATHLQALCTLSDTPKAVNPNSLTKLIQAAPDPATALGKVLQSMPSPSEALATKWRQIVKDIWAAGHPHIPALLELPLAASDISSTVALQHAHDYLRFVDHQPLHMIEENKDWLISPDDVHSLATQLSHLHHQPVLQTESEWQYLSLHRLRRVLQSLRLIRRYKSELVIVKSRYQKFLALPLVQQHYLLWHADAYHIDWSDYAGIWGNYFHVVQEYSPFLWSISHNKKPDIAVDLRQWNRAMLESFYLLWQQEGLLDQHLPETALFSLVRFQSLPTALTQVILRDLYIKHGLIYGQGTQFAYTTFGLKLLEQEYQQELPCNLDLI